ncbi:MAG: CRISPR-associated endoribonuclease Cas6 [Mollicutes bacterium]|nr:CRISPR-associated endoribonuclease Cas6 [Mollicutes bacterium]
MKYMEGGEVLRILLELKLDKNEFPKDYHSTIISYIKNSLTKCNNGKEYIKFYRDNNIKNFCFTVMLGKCKFNRENIALENNIIRILISIGDEGMNKYIIFNALIGETYKSYPLPNDNKMVLINIKKLKDVEIKTSNVIFKTATGSGICVREHDPENNKDKYYVFNEEGFEKQLKYVIKKQALEAGFSNDIAERVKFTPINCRKVVTKHYGTYVDVTVGIFKMEADSKLLQHLYLCGLGSRTSMSYGVLDLISDEGGEV